MITRSLQLAVLSRLCLPSISAFTVTRQKTSLPLRLSEASGDVEDGDEQPILQQSTVRIDDGGADLTDRFKHKVHALMGDYDPKFGEDNERQDGNILDAMLHFPTQFSFTAVGRTNGEDSLKEDYVEQVKKIVTSMSGDEDKFQCKIAPRGKSFTRVSIQVTVESAAVINSIYDELGKVEMTVMKY